MEQITCKNKEIIPTDAEPRIGIISALDNEIRLLLKKAQITETEKFGEVEFHVGNLAGCNVVIVKSGMGKVLAASVATALLMKYNISSVMFTGIAGGVGDETKVLDIVVGESLVQSDYGIMSKDGFQWSTMYSTDGARYKSDKRLVEIVYEAAVEVSGKSGVFKGLIASGDQFVASEEYVDFLRREFGALACEMEGAALASVCSLFKIPFVVLRTMSDKADGKAHESFAALIDKAADKSCSIILKALDKLKRIH